MLVGTYILIILTFAIESQVPHKPNVLLSWKYESGILSRIFFFFFFFKTYVSEKVIIPPYSLVVLLSIYLCLIVLLMFSLSFLQRFPSCWFSVYSTYLGQSIAVLFLYVL